MQIGSWRFQNSNNDLLGVDAEEPGVKDYLEGKREPLVNGEEGHLAMRLEKARYWV